jgi:uncharacterized protein
MRNQLICLLAMMILPLSAFAVKVKEMYQVQLPVVSQSDHEREDAVQKGFRQILLRASGDPKIEQNSTIRENLNKANYYVQEYSYLEPAPNASEYIIQIRYDKKQVHRFLTEAGASYWGENRPLILTWLTVSLTGRPSEIVNSGSGGTIAEAIKEQTKKYGLPLILPVMDMDDMSKITPTDVNEMTMPILKEAAKRYSPDVYLVGKMQQEKDIFRSDWRLLLGNDEWHWTASDKNPAQIIATVMSEVSATLSKYYEVKLINTKETWIKLEVSNINDRTELNSLIQQINQLQAVQQVQLSQVMGDVVDLSVQIRGTLEGFLQSMAINHYMEFKGQDAATNMLNYRWHGTQS